jgi:Trypsin-like peptidase domain
MFQKACEIARKFTWPVVISRLSVDGNCTAGIGTFIPVNKDGWIVTATHILQVTVKLTAEERQTAEHKANVARIENDQSLSRKERRRKLAQLGHLKSDAVERWSIWWGQDGAAIEPGSDIGLEAADVSVARLTGFDTSQIAAFPTFKKTSNDSDIGKSLCRTGFPFWEVHPVWDAATERFILTQNVPLPAFSNEGILARQFQTILADAAGNVIERPAFRIRGIETSNAGLLGQSGGPIFDENGTVWGVQTSTVSYQLDLNTEDNQYYNVGVGCHSETVIGLLNIRNVSHQSEE